MSIVNQQIHFVNNIVVDTGITAADTANFLTDQGTINLIKVKYRLLGYYDSTMTHTQSKSGMVYKNITDYGSSIVSTSDAIIWERENIGASPSALPATFQVMTFTGTASNGFFIRTYRNGNAYDVNAEYDITIHEIVAN